jgi:sugar phosphate isomerase/epimerase
MDRRNFIIAAAAFAAGCSRGPGEAGEASGTAMTKAAPLGLQLYTVRDLMAEDLAGTLELVADIGYREVEFAGYFDRSPADIRRHLDAVGLRAPAAHIGYGDVAADVNAVIEHAAAVGHEFVVVPSVPGDERKTLDDYLRHAENFNRWSEACRSAGLRFAYHNHDFEFGEIDGKIPYDVLLAETDPSRVEMELDLAWARAGNADPLKYFEAWPGRFPLCHIKDLDPNGDEADIGEGDVAFERIFASAKQAGLQHGFIERDHPDDARQSIRRNFDAINAVWSEHMS